MAPCCRVLWPPDPVPHAVNCAATYKQYVFTGGSNGTLVRWLQNESGEGFKPCLMLLGHDAGIVHMAIVPKGVGHLLLSVDYLGVCCLWDTHTGLCTARKQTALLADRSSVLTCFTHQGFVGLTTQRHGCPPALVVLRTSDLEVTVNREYKLYQRLLQLETREPCLHYSVPLATSTLQLGAAPPVAAAAASGASPAKQGRRSESYDGLPSDKFVVAATNTGWVVSTNVSDHSEESDNAAPLFSEAGVDNITAAAFTEKGQLVMCSSHCWLVFMPSFRLVPAATAVQVAGTGTTSAAVADQLFASSSCSTGQARMQPVFACTARINTMHSMFASATWPRNRFAFGASPFDVNAAAYQTAPADGAPESIMQCTGVLLLPAARQQPHQQPQDASQSIGMQHTDITAVCWDEQGKLQAVSLRDDAVVSVQTVHARGRSDHDVCAGTACMLSSDGQQVVAAQTLIRHCDVAEASGEGASGYEHASCAAAHDAQLLSWRVRASASPSAPTSAAASAPPVQVHPVGNGSCRHITASVSSFSQCWQGSRPLGVQPSSGAAVGATSSMQDATFTLPTALESAAAPPSLLPAPSPASASSTLGQEMEASAGCSCYDGHTAATSVCSSSACLQQVLQPPLRLPAQHGGPLHEPNPDPSHPDHDPDHDQRGHADGRSYTIASCSSNIVSSHGPAKAGHLATANRLHDYYYSDLNELSDRLDSHGLAGAGPNSGSSNNSSRSGSAVASACLVYSDGLPGAMLLQHSTTGEMRFCNVGAYAVPGAAAAQQVAAPPPWMARSAAGMHAHGDGYTHAAALQARAGHAPGHIAAGVMRGHCDAITCQLEFAVASSSSPASSDASHSHGRGCGGLPAMSKAQPAHASSSTSLTTHTRLLITGARDGSLRAWRTHSSHFGQPHFAVHPHAGSVQRVLLPRGDAPPDLAACVASIGDDGSLALVCTANGTVHQVCRGHSGWTYTQVVWSMRRGYIICGGHDDAGTPAVAVYDLASGELDRSILGPRAQAMMDACAHGDQAASSTAQYSFPSRPPQQHHHNHHHQQQQSQGGSALHGADGGVTRGHSSSSMDRDLHPSGYGGLGGFAGTGQYSQSRTASRGSLEWHGASAHASHVMYFNHAAAGNGHHHHRHHHHHSHHPSSNALYSPLLGSAAGLHQPGDSTPTSPQSHSSQLTFPTSPMSSSPAPSSYLLSSYAGLPAPPPAAAALSSFMPSGAGVAAPASTSAAAAHAAPSIPPSPSARLSAACIHEWPCPLPGTVLCSMQPQPTLVRLAMSSGALSASSSAGGADPASSRPGAAGAAVVGAAASRLHVAASPSDAHAGHGAGSAASASGSGALIQLREQLLAADAVPACLALVLLSMLHIWGMDAKADSNIKAALREANLLPAHAAGDDAADYGHPHYHTHYWQHQSSLHSRRSSDHSHVLQGDEGAAAAAGASHAWPPAGSQQSAGDVADHAHAELHQEHYHPHPHHARQPTSTAASSSTAATGTLPCHMPTCLVQDAIISQHGTAVLQLPQVQAPLPAAGSSQHMAATATPHSHGADGVCPTSGSAALHHSASLSHAACSLEGGLMCSSSDVVAARLLGLALLARGLMAARPAHAAAARTQAQLWRRLSDAAAAVKLLYLMRFRVLTVPHGPVAAPNLDVFARVWARAWQDSAQQEATQLLLAAYTDPTHPGSKEVCAVNSQVLAIVDTWRVFAEHAKPIKGAHASHANAQQLAALQQVLLQQCFPSVVVSAVACLHHLAHMPDGVLASTCSCLMELLKSPVGVLGGSHHHPQSRGQSSSSASGALAPLKPAAVWAHSPPSQQLAAAAAQLHGGSWHGPHDDHHAPLPVVAASLLLAALQGPAASVWRRQLDPWPGFIGRLLRQLQSSADAAAAAQHYGGGDFMDMSFALSEFTPFLDLAASIGGASSPPGPAGTMQRRTAAAHRLLCDQLVALLSAAAALDMQTFIRTVRSVCYGGQGVFLHPLLLACLSGLLSTWAGWQAMARAAPALVDLAMAALANPEVRLHADVLQATMGFVADLARALPCVALHAPSMQVAVASPLPVEGLGGGSSTGGAVNGAGGASGSGMGGGVGGMQEVYVYDMQSGACTWQLPLQPGHEALVMWRRPGPSEAGAVHGSGIGHGVVSQIRHSAVTTLQFNPEGDALAVYCDGVPCVMLFPLSLPWSHKLLPINRPALVVQPSCCWLLPQPQPAPAPTQAPAPATTPAGSGPATSAPASNGSGAAAAAAAAAPLQPGQLAMSLAERDGSSGGDSSHSTGAVSGRSGAGPSVGVGVINKAFKLVWHGQGVLDLLQEQQLVCRLNASQS